jgi:hypothetical protein
MILKHRRVKTKMASQRRSHSKYWEKFNAYHSFKLRMRHGRRKPIHWWRKV